MEGIPYIWNLKYDRNELISETETDSQIQRTDLWLSREERDGRRISWVLGLADAN